MVSDPCVTRHDRDELWWFIESLCGGQVHRVERPKGFQTIGDIRGFPMLTEGGLIRPWGPEFTPSQNSTPSQARRRRPLQVGRHRAQAQGTGLRNRTVAETGLVFEPKEFAESSHQ